METCPRCRSILDGRSCLICGWVELEVEPAPVETHPSIPAGRSPSQPPPLVARRSMAPPAPLLPAGRVEPPPPGALGPLPVIPTWAELSGSIPPPPRLSSIPPPPPSSRSSLPPAQRVSILPPTPTPTPSVPVVAPATRSSIAPPNDVMPVPITRTSMAPARPSASIPPGPGSRPSIPLRPSEAPQLETCPGCRSALPNPNPVVCEQCGKRLHRPIRPGVVVRHPACRRCGHKNKAEAFLCAHCGEQVMFVDKS